MNDFLNIDKFFRDIISVLFRLIIILYSLTIIILYDNVFPFHYYIFGVIVYLVIYFNLINKQNVLSKVRLFNDYLFILLVLYDKPVNDFFISSLIIIPIINSPNHTGKKRSILLYLFAVLVFFILALEDNNYLFFIPFGIFTIVGYAEYNRSKLIRFNEFLYSKIDYFFENEVLNNKPHKVYKKVKDIINNSKFSYFFNIDFITCYRINKDGEFVIVNSSKFIWNYKINEEKKIVTEITNRKNIFLHNRKITIDNIDYEKNIVLSVPSSNNGSPYIFTIFIKPNFLFPLHFFYIEFIKSIFKKLESKINYEYELKLEKLKTFEEISKKRMFVSNAENSVHFIKNKLSTIKNYIQLQKKISELPEGDNTRIELENLLPDELNRMDTALNQITDKAKQILNKSKNPFRFNIVDLHSLNRIFSIIRFQIDEAKIKIISFDISKLNISNTHQKIININIDGFGLTISHWIDNVVKYGFLEINIEFLEDDTSYTVLLKNSTNEDPEKLKKIISDYNSADNVALLKSKQYGLEQINDYLSQMQIKSSLQLDKSNQVIFSMIFKKI